MSIAVTPRVGPHSRRDGDQLVGENNILLALLTQPSGMSMGATSGRSRLALAGFIQSTRVGNSKRFLWTLTAAGRDRANTLAARGN